MTIEAASPQTHLANQLKNASLTKPVTTSLDDCLTSYTKDQMLEVAEQGSYEVKKSYTKARIAEDMANQMKEAVPAMLQHLTKEEAATLSDLLEEPIEGTSDELFLPFTFAKDLIDKGFAYLFLEGAAYTLLVPDEAAEWIASVEEDGTVQQQREQNQAIFEHVTALTNLYGTFDERVLWDSWNKHHPGSSIDKESFQEVVLHMEGKLNAYQAQDGIFFSPKHWDSEQALSLYQSWKDYPYYFPTREDVRYFSLNEIDKRTPPYEKMLEFLQEKYPLNQPFVSQVIYEISMNAVLDNRTQDLIQGLDESLGFSFESTEELQEFNALYQDLSEATRKWRFRGHTGAEIRELQRQAVNQNRRSAIQPAEKPEPVRVAKIGRNDPCPCGSGKKYKKCHGR